MNRAGLVVVGFLVIQVFSGFLFGRDAATKPLEVDFAAMRLEAASYSCCVQEPRLNNFEWLIPCVIAGMAQQVLSPETLDVLAELRVGTVVSLNFASPEGAAVQTALLASKGIRHCPFYITQPYDPASVIEICKTLIRETAANFPEGKAVVIHCEVGEVRTGAVLSAWLTLHSPLFSCTSRLEDKGAIAKFRNDIATIFDSFNKKKCDKALITSLVKSPSYREGIDLSARNEEVVALVGKTFPSLVGVACGPRVVDGALVSPGCLCRQLDFLGASGGSSVTADGLDRDDV